LTKILHEIGEVVMMGNDT